MAEGKPVKHVPGATYGYCPKCGAPAEMRQSRDNGNDRCTNKHVYPSITAVSAPHQAKARTK